MAQAKALMQEIKSGNAKKKAEAVAETWDKRFEVVKSWGLGGFDGAPAALACVDNTASEMEATPASGAWRLQLRA